MLWLIAELILSGSADRITVTPPDGVLCRPSSCALTLPEDQSGRMFLFEWVGG